MRIVHYTIILMLFLRCGDTFGQTHPRETPSSGWIELLSQLSNNSKHEASKAEGRLRDQMGEFMKQLATLLNDHNGTHGNLDEATRTRAAYLIELAAGEDGLRRAIPKLVEHVDFRVGGFVVAEHSELDGYPYAKALRAIGPTSIPHICEYLRVNEPGAVSDKQIQLFGWVLIEMRGFAGNVNLEPTIALLRAVVADSKDVRRAENLVRLLRHVEEYHARRGQ